MSKLSKPADYIPEGFVFGPENIIGREVARVIPFIQLFGLYVIAHGDLGPGGGFQGGVLLGVSVILYVLLYNQEAGYSRLAQRTNDVLISVGVLIYGGTGVLTVLLGGNFLQYGVLAANPEKGNHYGILGIEVGISIAVAAVMITLFNETIRRDDE